MQFPTTYRRFTASLLTLAILALSTGTADAGRLFGRRCHRGAAYQVRQTTRTVTRTRAVFAAPVSPCSGGVCPAPVRAVYQAPAPAPQSSVDGASDPLFEVNVARNRRGLHSLIFDGNFAAWASQNNSAQANRGLGHHVQIGVFQCAAVGTSSPQAAVNIWTQSAPHAAILYSRTITRAGLAVNGSCATLNCR